MIRCTFCHLICLGTPNYNDFFLFQNMLKFDKDRWDFLFLCFILSKYDYSYTHIYLPTNKIELKGRWKMFGLDTLKNKRFWILLIPFLFIVVIIFSKFPNMSEMTLIIFTLVLIAIFWLIFYFMNYLLNKKDTK